MGAAMTDIDWGRLIISQEPNGLQLLGQTVSLWLRRLRERAELAHFEERDLRDLGITRADVDYEVAKPFWRG
jgi:uncharacterized protein YjiS (DUF1127 family)